VFPDLLHPIFHSKPCQISVCYAQLQDRSNGRLRTSPHFLPSLRSLHISHSIQANPICCAQLQGRRKVRQTKPVRASSVLWFLRSCIVTSLSTSLHAKYFLVRLCIKTLVPTTSSFRQVLAHWHGIHREIGL
jgi:hypothetical protein